MRNGVPLTLGPSLINRGECKANYLQMSGSSHTSNSLVYGICDKLNRAPNENFPIVMEEEKHLWRYRSSNELFHLMHFAKHIQRISCKLQCSFP